MFPTPSYQSLIISKFLISLPNVRKTYATVTVGALYHILVDVLHRENSPITIVTLITDDSEVLRTVGGKVGVTAKFSTVHCIAKKFRH